MAALYLIPNEARYDDNLSISCNMRRTEDTVMDLVHISNNEIIVLIIPTSVMIMQITHKYVLNRPNLVVLSRW